MLQNLHKDIGADIYMLHRIPYAGQAASPHAVLARQKSCKGSNIFHFLHQNDEPSPCDVCVYRRTFLSHAPT